MQLRNLLLALGLAAVLASPAQASNWTWNVGYHNPDVSTWGLNLFYIGSNWGFETGIGWIDAKTQEKTDTQTGEKKTTGANVNLAGDVNLKYFLTSGKFRPYLQGGLGVGLGAAAGHNAGLGAGAGGGFAGLGLLIGSPSFYAYGSYNFTSGSDFAQAGIGFGL